MGDDQDLQDDGSINSQLEWEFEEGIPQHEDPFILKYMDGRNALIEQEKKQRHDYVFKRTMSPFVQQAAKIMAAVRRRELHEKWNSHPREENTIVCNEDTFPGMMFSLARERIETTEIWKIIQRMPKGALLHAHMDAMIDLDWMVDQVMAEKGVCMMATEALTDESKRKSVSFGFKYCSADQIQKHAGANIWAAEYTPNTPVLVSEASKTFPAGSSFKDWVVARCSITPEESLLHHHGLDVVWSKFSSTFPIMNTMFFYEPIFRRGFARMLGELTADGIMYCDFRMVFLFDFHLEGKETAETGYAKFFEIFDEEIEKFKETEAGKNFIGARMIWTVLRILDNRAIAESMKECIAIKQQYPHLICGFDCVGQEDLGRTLQDLTPLLFWFKKKCFEAGMDIPFFFHAGECLGDGDSTDNNLFDAILLGTRRIGHGYSLFKHPLLIDMVKEKKILVESCPISNEILRLSSSILSHTLPALLSRGVAVSLNNDDPAVLGHGQNGLSHDFWQAFMGSENMGLEGLATMAENSLRWCAVEDQKQSEWIKGINESYRGSTIKSKMLKQWRSEFYSWCQWIIMEYILDDDDDEDDGNDLVDEEEGIGEDVGSKVTFAPDTHPE